MKKIAAIFLVLISILLLVTLSARLFGCQWFDGLKIEVEYFPLWASVGVIISALMATTMASINIDNATSAKKTELEKQKFTELNYALHVLGKIQVISNTVLKNIEDHSFSSYTAKGLEQMRLDIQNMSNKLDSKELFYFLSKDEAGKFMNIIARLNSIAYALETEKEKTSMAQVIRNNLVDHKSGYSLLPFVESTLHSIGNEVSGLRK